MLHFLHFYAYVLDDKIFNCTDLVDIFPHLNLDTSLVKFQSMTSVWVVQSFDNFAITIAPLLYIISYLLVLQFVCNPVRNICWFRWPLGHIYTCLYGYDDRKHVGTIRNKLKCYGVLQSRWIKHDALQSSASYCGLPFKCATNTLFVYASVESNDSNRWSGYQHR